MPSQLPDEDTLRQTVETFRRVGSEAGAARELGWSRSTFITRLRRAERLGLLSGEAAKPEESGAVLPQFPDQDLGHEKVLDYLTAGFDALREYKVAQHWAEIKIKERGPVGICWVGDPHLGNPGCDIRLLRRHVELLASEPHCYAVNIGDTVDNWGGRLLRLYAETAMTRRTERVLARWFLQDAGIKWLVWLYGNHDVMDGALTAYLEGINAARVPMVDWRARFRVTFPRGPELRVDAAHDHKGHSMWNQLHGQIRAAVMDEPADLYVAGHHHVHGQAIHELPGGRLCHLMRVRGYKFLDEHAERNGFPEQSLGSSILSVIDPEAPPASRITNFLDIERGLEYLRWRRG